MEAEHRETCRRGNRGVPQGSILGRLIYGTFSIMTFCISISQMVSLISFADDMTMIVQAETEEIHMNKANVGLHRVA